MGANICSNRVAVVTGASRGIGRAIALRLANEGAAVALVSRGRGKVLGRSLAGTAAEIEEAGGRSLAISADLSDPALDRGGIIDCVERELGAVDILVNNSAQILFKDFLDHTKRELMAMQEVNVWAPWELCQRVMPSMIGRGSGWILNIGSGAGQPQYPPFPGHGLYVGTKAMLMASTRVLAAETAGRGVAVNVLLPHAASLTEMIEGWVDDGSLSADLTEPLEAMAEAALALCTVDAGAIHGEVWQSLPLLVALHRPARSLDGGHIVAGGSLTEMAATIDRIEAELTKGAPELRDVETHP
jgi:NAD(P)-dependent dehydrogenase (short-subunit alcohol dehydrogenase family)